MNNMQQEFERLRGILVATPETGAQAWDQLQDLSTQGFRPAQIFVAMQKLKAAPPLYDLCGALELLRILVAETKSSGDDHPVYTESLYWLGEALMCHYPAQSSEAYTYLLEAGKLGHVEARLNLVYCLRHGLGVAPDPDTAIDWLRKAVKQGHPRAFFELGVQLAQASDAPDNRKEAMSALQQAAACNYPAAGVMARQLAQLGQLPKPESTRQTLSTAPTIETISALLDPMECSHLAVMSMPHLKPSRVISDAQSARVTDGRSSEGMSFHHGLRDMVTTNIIKRLCVIAGGEFSHTEGLTVLMYRPAAQYRVHPDYFPVDSAGGQRQLENGGQRIKTLICYLNEVEAGGETEFPDLGIKVKPEPGSVVYFENADSDGKPYTNSRHAGLPVISGSKWISTLWLRQRDHDQWGDQQQ